MSQRAAPTAFAVLVATAVAGAAAVTTLDRGERAERRREAGAAAAEAAADVQEQLERTFGAAHALAAVVRHGGRLDGFDAVAAEMLRVYPGAAALQLAPGGVIAQVFPSTGNEAALGLDLFARGERAVWAVRARDSRELTVEGPFRLAQGGLGLVGRLAVFRSEAGGAERFWGFTAAVVRLEPFLARAGLDRLDARGYAWTLASGDGEPPFAASRADVPRDPVSVRVRLPNATWTLSAAPVAGFGSPWTYAGRLALVLAIAGVVAALVHRTLREPEVLSLLVAERTRELEEARSRLERELQERLRAEAGQRAAEERAREAQKLEAIGQLAGGVAHDFNNLLVGIIGYADLLQEPGAPVGEAAQGIRQAAERAAALTRQLLGLARRGKFVSAAVDLAALVREVAALLGRTIDKGIAVEVRGAAPATVLGDAGQLQQVVLNLAVNARDAMPHGGRLVLELAREHLDGAAARALPGLAPGPYVVLRVSDTGAGIPDELRPRIFEPFFTTKEPGRGTGLGLAVVYGIVRNHGGAIAFESKPGAGTTFTLHLPAHDGVAEQPAATPAPRRGRGAVLVVDDEAVVRSAAVRMLAACGYEARGAAGAEEAVALLRSGASADVALVDLVMPGQDGVACLQAMRGVRPGLTAVLSSGFGEDRRVQDALAAGFAGFLYKPYGKAELVDAVQLALGHPAAGA